MRAMIRFGLALWPCVGLLAPAMANPVPLQATLALSSQAQIDGLPLQFDRMSQTQGGSLDEMTFTTNAVATSEAGTAMAFTSIDAVWQDPGTGTVTFGDTGFLTDLDDTGTVAMNGTHWTYRFNAGGDDQLLLDYNVQLTTDTTDSTGLSGIRFVVIQGGYLPVFDQTIVPGSANTFVVPLDPTEQYTISLIPVARLSTTLGARTAGMTGDFNFFIGLGP